MAVLKFNLTAGETTPGGVLAPVLAPFGLDLPAISKEINRVALLKFQKGVPIPVKLFLYGSKQVRVEIGGPTSTFYLQQLQFEAATIQLVDLYNLIRLISRDRTVPLLSASSTLFATLYSFSKKPVISF